MFDSVTWLRRSSASPADLTLIDGKASSVAQLQLALGRGAVRRAASGAGARSIIALPVSVGRRFSLPPRRRSVQRHLIGPDGADRLVRLPLFEGVLASQRRMLGELVHEFEAEAGETILVEGEHGYEFTMIEEGEAEVVQNGRRIRELGPGDFFGELAILGHGTPRTATVIAKSNIRGLGFNAHFLHQIRERVPEVGERIEREAGQRLESNTRAAGSSGQ
jgi:hypothetical protein